MTSARFEEEIARENIAERTGGYPSSGSQAGDPPRPSPTPSHTPPLPLPALQWPIFTFDSLTVSCNLQHGEALEGTLEREREMVQ